MCSIFVKFDWKNGPKYQKKKLGLSHVPIELQIVYFSHTRIVIQT